MNIRTCVMQGSFLRAAVRVMLEDVGVEQLTADLMAAKPGSRLHRDVVEEFVGAVVDPTRRARFMPVYTAMCELAGIDADEYLDVHDEYERRSAEYWRARQRKTLRRPKELEQMADAVEDKRVEVNRALVGVSPRAVEQELMRRAGAASVLDWRPSETMPEDYYAL